MTPAVEQVVAQAGVLTSFAEASQQTLKSLCGLTVGESTVERVTEAAGQRLIERIEQNQTLGPACEWPWQRDAQGRTCAYVAVDHTGIRQQGPGGARAEGRVKLAEALHPGDDAARQQWLDAWCHALKHEGGPAVLAKLEALDLSMHPQSVRAVHQSHVGYFRNQAHRMDYPTYVANGWQIGSGPVESACKTLVGNRLKGGGMRWGEAGANAVSHLRAVYLSDPNCWHALWQSTAA